MCKPGHNWINDLKIDTVIDVGASIGDFSTAVRQWRPEAFIYAFEPLPTEFNKLCERFKLDKNFREYNIALSDRTGSTKFNRFNFSPASSELKMTSLLTRFIDKEYSMKTESDEIIVMLDKLDSVLMPELMGKSLLVKIDVQGTEDKVIWGGQKIIKTAKLCFIETEFQPLYEGQALFFDILIQMKALGFTYFGDKEQVWYHQTNGTPLWQDSIFINNELLTNGIYEAL